MCLTLKFLLMTINQITSIIIEECIYIHKKLGPGLFENVYEKVLTYRLEKRGLNVENQKAIPVIFEGIKMNVGYRVDLLVNQKVIVELKSIDLMPPVMQKQLITYLRLLNMEIGLLINFNVYRLTDGIQRIANNYVEE